MADVYLFVPNGKVNDAVTCGLKLSEWGEREIEVEGIKKKCIISLLNPKDDMDKYNSTDFTCLRLDIKMRHCFVADGLLYEASAGMDDAKRLFADSIVQADKYKFGSYRRPECLVTSTVISDQIKVLDKRIDLPILYDNSEELYKNNIIENYREEFRNFDDMALYAFNMKLSEVGKSKAIIDEQTGTAIFVNNENGAVFTVKIPSFE